MNVRGIGVIARDPKGRVVGVLNRHVQSDDIKCLEAQDVLEGIRLVIDRGSKHLEVETDASNVIKHIQG